MPLLPPMNPPLTDWQGRRVWVVGASSGIGRATASALHAHGAQVWVSARNASALAGFASEHPGSLPLPLDVTDAAAVTHAARHIAANGPLDLVCICAGHYRAMRADTLDLAEALRHQQVNVTGAWHVLAAVLPGLLARGSGHISVVGSVAGWRGLPKSLAYGPTKAALQHLAEVLYLDLHPRGIGVSVVAPGFVATPLTAQNDFAMPALLTPEQAATELLRGWARGQFLIHFPKRFTRVLQVLRLLPYRWYFSLARRLTGL
jgi:NAD(P)-dependent dehydrogenase (short-subunit alcohol dehydrogenase family)